MAVVLPSTSANRNGNGDLDKAWKLAAAPPVLEDLKR